MVQRRMQAHHFCRPCETQTVRDATRTGTVLGTKRERERARLAGRRTNLSATLTMHGSPQKKLMDLVMVIGP
jgi:hypothetical protein